VHFSFAPAAEIEDELLMTELSAFPSVSALARYIEVTFPAMRTVVDRGYGDFGLPWAERLEETLRTLLPSDPALHKAVDGYIDFSLDALRLHRRFEKERVYPKKSYAEAAAAVYDNPDYMNDLYLPGILLSHFLWPHHYRQRLFFESSVLADMKRAGARQFFDVGVGSGYYSRLALSAIPELMGRGFDVSKSSRDYALWQVGAFGAGARYEVQLGDITALDPAPQTDWLFSVEVLEHLEDPVTFLRGLRRLLAPTGKAFITAALNAPNEDHIYLYRNVAEVMEQLRQSGFAVEQFHSCFAYKPKRIDDPVPEIAAFVAVPM
jgi:SAM-dependent methyltransferase